jgi:hypothetical protein
MAGKKHIYSQTLMKLTYNFINKNAECEWLTTVKSMNMLISEQLNLFMSKSFEETIDKIFDNSSILSYPRYI